MQNSRPHVSHSQKNHLLGYLQKNPKLAYRKFTPSFSVKDARKEWTSLATTLNSLPGRGSVKTWKQWRKTWQDLKSKTKMKFLQGYDALTREEKLIFKITGGFGDNIQSPTNKVLKSETEESGIDSDYEYIIPSDANDCEQENLEEEEIHENIIIHVVSDETEDRNCDINLKTEYSAVSQNRDAEDEETDGKSSVEDDITADHSSDKKETEFTGSYREQKLMYLRRMARAQERSAIINERIADALERIASAGESVN